MSNELDQYFPNGIVSIAALPLSMGYKGNLNISEDLLHEIILWRQESRCIICDRPDGDGVFHYLIPRRFGKYDHFGNLVYLCQSCDKTYHIAADSLKCQDFDLTIIRDLNLRIRRFFYEKTSLSFEICHLPLSVWDFQTINFFNELDSIKSIIVNPKCDPFGITSRGLTIAFFGDFNIYYIKANNRHYRVDLAAKHFVEIARRDYEKKNKKPIPDARKEYEKGIINPLCLSEKSYFSPS